MKVYRISAVTLIIKNMKRSCNFYSHIPGFKLVYGGSSYDSFSTYEIDKKFNTTIKMYLNLELSKNNHYSHNRLIRHFGRIIFHTKDVDKLYFFLKNKNKASKDIIFENEPIDAPWGERYFHLREPDGYQLSFAMPIKKRKRRKRRKTG
ncbi:MAG TPA: VOC family protein [Nitrososphaeraceae archaeon]|jgi:catechol 2,3-dioxygenase-like lactoylglutathione lyase family enzyme